MLTKDNASALCFVCGGAVPYANCPECHRGYCSQCYTFFSTKAELLSARHSTIGLECFVERHFQPTGESSNWNDGHIISRTRAILQAKPMLPFARTEDVAVAVIRSGGRTALVVDLLLEVCPSLCSSLETIQAVGASDKLFPPKQETIGGITYTIVDCLKHPTGKFSHVYGLTAKKEDGIKYVLKQYKSPYKARFELEKQNYGRLADLKPVLGRHVADLLGANDERLYLVMTNAGDTIAEITSKQYDLCAKLCLSTEEDFASLRLALAMQASWISYAFASNGIAQNDAHAKNIMGLLAPPGHTWSLAYTVPLRPYVEATCPILLVVIDFNLATTVPTSSTRSMSRSSVASGFAIPSAKDFASALFKICNKIVCAASKNED